MLTNGVLDMRDRVSMDELDHDIKGQAEIDAREAVKATGKLEEAALALYHSKLDDPQLMWEALGPDGFKGPYPDTNTIFAGCQNKTAEIEHEASIREAIKNNDALELGTILLEQCRSYLLDGARECVEENWSDYE